MTKILVMEDQNQSGQNFGHDKSMANFLVMKDQKIGT